MGTDIHLYVEKYVEGEGWQEVQAPYIISWDKLSRSWSPWYENKNLNDPRPDPTRRNYNLFAFLADVRNGVGFGGIRTGKRVTPQVSRRGVPSDTSWNEIKPTYLGDHSFTHATVRELLDLDWTVNFNSTGVVGPEGFLQWREEGIPNSWSGNIMGGGIKVWDDTEYYAMLVDRDIYRRSANGQLLDYCRVSWDWQPLIGCDFYRWCEEVLLPLSDKNGEDIRILMGFDS